MMGENMTFVLGNITLYNYVTSDLVKVILVVKQRLY